MSQAVPPTDVVLQLNRTQRWTGSWLVAYASGVDLRPGWLAPGLGGACAACGHVFCDGELGLPNPAAGSKSFNDCYSMHGGDDEPICSACDAIWGRPFLMEWSKGIATLDGLFPFASNADKAWWLKNPPQGPYVVAHGLAKQQHLYWRTPVSWSPELMVIRVGPHLGTVRRQWVLGCLDTFDSLLADAEQFKAIKLEGRLSKSKPAKTPRRPSAKDQIRRHPFVRLDRELVDMHHLALKRDVQDFLAHGPASPSQRRVASLNAVEGWALAALVNDKEVLKAKPAPLATPAFRL